MRVALFITCMNNVLYPSTGSAVVKVIERLGHQVDYVDAQTCCGQMHLNAGYRRDGLALARKTIGAFSRAEAVIIPSGSCAATMRHLWADVAADEADQVLVDAANEFSPKVYEFSEFLVDRLGITDVGATFSHRVAYHPTCHSLRSLRVGDRPTALLRAVKGLELVELERADSCCGFGGLFAVKNADTSAAMGNDKVEFAHRSGAEYLCASDNSCLTHVRELSTKQRRPLQTIHLAEILASEESQ